MKERIEALEAEVLKLREDIAALTAAMLQLAVKSPDVSYVPYPVYPYVLPIPYYPTYIPWVSQPNTITYCSDTVGATPQHAITVGGSF